MSFQQATHDKARRAISEGNVALLKSLIKRPVQSTSHSRLTWLKTLVTDAAKAGLSDAVDHLLALSPGHTSTGPRVVDAWVAAQEAGHQELAEQLKARLPNDPNDTRTWQNTHGWFSTAVEASAWHVALKLMNEGYEPASGQVAYALKRLGGARAEVRHPAAGPLLRQLIPVAIPGALAWATVVALRCSDDDSFNACLARAERKDLIKESVELAESALQADRFDLFERVTAHLGQTRTDQELAESALDRALVSHRFQFMADVIAGRPGVKAWLQSHDETAVSLSRQLLLQVDGPVHEAVQDQVRRTLFGHFCSDGQADKVKADLEQRYRTPGAKAGLHQALNTMAVWVSPDIRERWFENEPVTFAESIAWTRSQTTLGHHDEPQGAPRRKPRVRA